MCCRHSIPNLLLSLSKSYLVVKFLKLTLAITTDQGQKQVFSVIYGLSSN